MTPAQRVAAQYLQAGSKNPCPLDESFAWVDPVGHVYYLDQHQSHAEFAALWCRQQGIDAPAGFEDLPDEEQSWANPVLIQRGWARVVNAETIQATELHQHPKQTDSIIEIVLGAVRGRCLDYRTKMYILESVDQKMASKRPTVEEFIKNYGGRKVVDQMYEIMGWGKPTVLPADEAEAFKQRMLERKKRLGLTASADPATFTHVFLTPKSQNNLLPIEDQEREPQTVLGPGSATTNSPQDTELEWPRTGEGSLSRVASLWLLRQAADPKYEDYVKKQERDRKPVMKKEQWATKVFGNPDTEKPNQIKHPKGFRDESSEPELTDSNHKKWEQEHSVTTANGSTVSGTPHDVTEHPKVFEQLKKHVADIATKALANRKHVVFLGEGQSFEGETDTDETYSEQHAIAKHLHSVTKGKVKQDTWDDGPVDLTNPKAQVWDKLTKATGGNKTQAQAHMAIAMAGQGEGWSSLKQQGWVDKDTADLVQKQTGVDITKRVKKSDKQKLYDLTFPQDNKQPETETSHLFRLYNSARQDNMLSKIKKIESEGGVAIVTPGATHAYNLKHVLAPKNATVGKTADFRSLPQPWSSIPNTQEEREDPYSGLHARTIPVPGDQYNIDDETKFDYETPTRKKVAQRYLASLDKTADPYKKRIPWVKEHRQEPATRLEDKQYYKRHKNQIKLRLKRWYKKNHKNRQFQTQRDQYEINPRKYKRQKSASVLIDHIDFHLLPEGTPSSIVEVSDTGIVLYAPYGAETRSMPVGSFLYLADFDTEQDEQNMEAILDNLPDGAVQEPSPDDIRHIAEIAGYPLTGIDLYSLSESETEDLLDQIVGRDSLMGKTAADTFQYDIRPPDANLEKPDMAPGSGESTPSAGGWWTKQTPDLTHTPKSPDVPVPGPENFPASSAKVIPDSMKVATRFLVATFNSRTAATIDEILKHTDPAIKARAKKIKPRLQRADQKLGLWTFTVPGSDGSYTVKLRALKPDTEGGSNKISDLDIQVSCDCDFFRWQGPEHYAVLHKYMYKRPEGTAEKPTEKDPDGKNWLCKHAIACLSMAYEHYEAKPDR